MINNTFGKNFAITSFGESHGKHIGVVIDGCPSNFELDLAHIQNELQRRRPGQSEVTTSRLESDDFEFTSGIFENKTTGAPITILIPNKNAQPTDYDHLKSVYRPSHADYTYEKKYGHRDFAGGGRSSARITAGWVAAGAVAKQVLAQFFDIQIMAYVSQIHHVACPKSIEYTLMDIEKSIVRCPNAVISAKMVEVFNPAKSEGDSDRGIVPALLKNCSIDVGDSVFNKFNAQLANAKFSHKASKGVQITYGSDTFSKNRSASYDHGL